MVEFDLLNLSHRDGSHIDKLGLLAKEGWQKARLGEYHSYRQALSRFTVGAILISEPIVDAVRRELRRMSDGLKVTEEEIRAVLANEVIKREVLEGDKATTAQRQVARATQRAARRSRERTSDVTADDTSDSSPPDTAMPVPTATGI